MIPFDLSAFVNANAPAYTMSVRPEKFKNPMSPGTRNSGSVFAAADWLSKQDPAISGQKGGNHTFGIACTLIKGFLLTESEASEILAGWNLTCSPPWSDRELARKISEAAKSPDINPPGWMNSQYSSVADMFEHTFEAEEIPAGQHDHSEVLNDPASIAIRFIETHTREEGICTYQYYEQDFYQWDGDCYAVVPKEVLRSIVAWFIEKTYLDKFLDDCNNAPEDDIDKIKKKKVTASTIDQVITMMINQVLVLAEGRSEPFWIGKPIREEWEPSDMIPFANRLVHLQSFVENGRVAFTKKTPKYFSTYSLPYRFEHHHYDGPIEPPPIWGKFLRDLWGDDDESIQCLREWFGYLMLPSTKQQKLLMLIGPPRSGKGTILRIIKEVVGARNYGSTTFKKLVSDFGLEPLADKTVVIIPDARITTQTDIGAVVEQILSITGEDEQAVNPKHKRQFMKKLNCRFVIGSNVIPRLTESSLALVERAIILRFKKTYLNVEDELLSDKIKTEVSQIMRWAIDGWKSLHDRRRFKQPSASAGIIRDFKNLSSPIHNFTSRFIDIGEDYECDFHELFLQWVEWTKHMHMSYSGDKMDFLRSLRSASPHIEVPETDGSGGDSWASEIIRGIRLRPSPDIEFDAAIPSTNGHFEYGDDEQESTPPF